MTVLIWQDDSGQTVSLRFDVVTSENHDSTNIITEHPVEEGADISDHVRPELDRVSIEAYVTNKPLPTNPDADQMGSFAPVFLPDGSAATVWQPNSFRDRVREMFESLQDAQKNHRIIRLETRMREYDNMVVERVSAPRTVEDGSGASFQLDLKEIRFVQAETVDAPEPAELRGAQRKAVGSKNTEDGENAEQKSEKAKSIAARLLDGAGSSLGDLFGAP